MTNQATLSTGRAALVLVMILAGLCTCAGRQDSQDSEQIAELERLNDSWNRAWIEKDAAAVDRLMAREYVYVAPNGQVLDRQKIQEILRSPGYKIHRGTRTQVVVRPITSDTAAILHHWQGEGSFEGAEFVDNHRCMMLCARRDGAWQVVLEQCSAIGP